MYLVLGAAGSGRREVLADLIEGGLGGGDRPAVLLSVGEPDDAADARLPNVSRWRLLPEAGIEGEFPEGATHVFIVSDGRANPVDQVEAVKAWLGLQAAEVALVICVVDCWLAEHNPRLFAWYEACIHFSDVVLLGHREGVPSKWVDDFRKVFEGRFYPCIFEHVKNGRVGNPALVLAPVARRISHVFDEPEWAAPEEDEDDEVEMKPVEDPYLERRAGGRRVHEFPDIRNFLPGPKG